MIDGVSGSAWTASLPKAAPLSNTAVFVVRTNPTAETPAMTAKGAIGFGAMIAMQEYEETNERNRQARRRGEALLHVLAKMQWRLLSGGLTAGDLHDLADLAGMDTDAPDPGMRAVVAAITLRARIELARCGMAGKTSHIADAPAQRTPSEM